MNNLHDSNPKNRWDNLHLLRKIFWLVIYISIVVIIFIIHFENLFLKVIIIIFIAILGWLSYKILKKLENEYIYTLWDDVDYTGIIKQDFPFKSTKKTKLFAYFYHREEIKLNLNLSSRKYPVIIGFHGWGAQHREMDRYCLPLVKNRDVIYFTYDALGQGLSPGDQSDFTQFENARRFIDLVLEQPYIDKSRVGVVGMSFGAAKASVVAYNHPYIKSLVMLSGVYDLKKHFDTVHRIIRWILFRKLGKMNINLIDLEKYSGINYLKPEGVILFDQQIHTQNKERVFLAANKHDKGVNYSQTLAAIEKLNLPPENYRIFEKGDHRFEGNEFYLAVDIFQFLDRNLLH